MLAAAAPPDDELLARADAQDLDALSVLVDRYHALALSVAMTVTQELPRAADAVDAAYLTLWRGAARYNPADLGPHDWLLLLTRYFASDARRQPPPARSLCDTNSAAA